MRNKQRDSWHRPAIRRSLLATATILAATALQAEEGDRQPPEHPVAQRIEELLDVPAARRTFWGILVKDLATGETAYERNPDKLFLPASNVKLYATALALRRLGADYRFETVVSMDGPLDEEGVLRGSLRLVGGGDPNLSSRILPYRRKEDFGPDPLEPVRRLARQVQESGVRRVTGSLVGDDSRYVWQPYPPGWSHADTLEDYGSPVSALVLNDNIIKVRVLPGSPSGPAQLSILPALPYYKVSNRTMTVAGRYATRRLAVRRGEEPGEFVFSGQIPSRSRGRTFLLAAQDPALYAAHALHAALGELGIEIEGAVTSRHLFPDGLASLQAAAGRDAEPAGESVARMPSADLAEVVRVVNKDSENLHAEMLLREVGLHESSIGSHEAGIASLRRFLAEAGLGSAEYHLQDGSGLSRRNLVSPTATVRLLEHMWGSPDRDSFVQSLPVAGHDGTLEERFQRSPARGRIRAKTGSMSHVLALAGYADDGSGTSYAFAIYANNFGMASSSTRRLVDLAAAAIVAPGPD